MYIDLDNCSNRVVKTIRISLYQVQFLFTGKMKIADHSALQRDTTYEGGRRTGKRHSVRTKIHRDEFYQGSRFPLSPYSKYEVCGLTPVPRS